MAFQSRQYPPKGNNNPEVFTVDGLVITPAADSVPVRTQGLGYTVAKVNTGRISITTEWTWDALISVTATAVTAAGAARLAQYKLSSASPTTRTFEIMTTDGSGSLAHMAAGDGFMFTAKFQASRLNSV